MAGRRGFGGRSREDLYKEVEDVSEMLAQLKSTGSRGHGERRGAAPPHERRWRPDLPPHQEWEEGPKYTRGSWRHESNRSRPQRDVSAHHHYPPGPAHQDCRRRNLDERPRERPMGPPPSTSGDPVTAQQLVEILARSQNFSISLLNLLEEHYFPSQQVKLIVASHGHLFLLQNEVVTLAPRLKLCISHSSHKGCQSHDTCDGLHMCPKFVFSWCSENRACVLGHRWHTDHNLAILKRLSMEYVRYPVLRQLLRGSQVQNRGRQQREVGPLGVCRDYNEGRCDQDHCSCLHVCLSFVVGLTVCSHRNCHLNHNLLSPDCCHLLRLHKLPVNEAPRDVAMALLQANPDLKDMTLASSSVKTTSTKSAGKGQARTDKVVKGLNKQRGAVKNRTPRKKENDNDSLDSEDTNESKSDSEEDCSSSSREEKKHGREGSHTPRKGINRGTHKQRGAMKNRTPSKKGSDNVSLDSKDTNDSENDSEEDCSSSSREEKKHGREGSHTPRKGVNRGTHKQRGAMKKRTPRKKESDKDSLDSEDANDSKNGSEEDCSSSSRGKKKHGRELSHSSKKGVNRGTHRQKRFDESSKTNGDSDDPPDKNDQCDNPSKKQPNSKEQMKPDSNNSNTAASKQKAPQPPNPSPRLRTLWAHDLHGDVATPQICYYSVEGMCRDEATGCPRLHALTHFHWQVRPYEQDSRWHNLRFEQAACIERAFCDAASDGMDLPLLDPSKLEPSLRGLILLLGRSVWHADFPTMTLINTTQSKSLQLRRLCTQPVPGQTIKAATHHWYFQDVNKKWVMYGKVDTADRKDLVSSLTSADIEKHYLQNPAQPLSFKNSKFTYVLYLPCMVQQNQLTSTNREVRRRPEPHLPEETNDKARTKSASDLPQHWDAMQPEERSRLVTLAPTSDEYKKVVGLLSKAVPPSNVIKVERLQNPFMWRALQNKIKELASVYKDKAKVNERYVFYSTSPNAVPSICTENFDWRLHGNVTGQIYGRGTCFFPDVRSSYRYCQPDSNGYKYMFVARVAVGSMTVGNSSMARPPINPTTSMPFDSTVDQLTNPRRVVKYSTQEYYPEYLITFF